MATRVAKTAMVRARIEPKLKERAEAVLRKIGISPSEAVNVFYARIAAEKAIPFSLNIPNAVTHNAIMEARHKRDTLPAYDSTEEMFADILGDEDS